jgi:hypothetical protein
VAGSRDEDALVGEGLHFDDSRLVDDYAYCVFEVKGEGLLQADVLVNEAPGSGLKTTRPKPDPTCSSHGMAIS